MVTTTQHDHGGMPCSLCLLVRDSVINNKDQKQHREKKVSINLPLSGHSPSLRGLRTETQSQQEPGDLHINAETMEAAAYWPAPHSLPAFLYSPGPPAQW